MSLKAFAISILEKHPFGYALGLAIMESNSFFLPHEKDFYAMPLIASPTQKNLFLDVGANRGHSALGFSKIMPGWEVISIEANPIHQPRLEKLKKRKKLFNYVIAAADQTSGKTVTLWTPHYGMIYCHSSTAVDRHEAIRSIEMSFPKQSSRFKYTANEVKTLALDDLALQPKIIKIDIQGKEIACLNGLIKTIQLCRPAFLIECNLEWETISQFMHTIAYSSYIYSNNKLLKVESKPSFTHSRNVFFTPNEQPLTNAF